MGIKNLLQELRPITDAVHISALSGHTVGVDASCWLHRAAQSCAYELVEKKETTLYLGFCKRLLDMLRHHLITPIIVFDGRELPHKRNENLKRRESRADAKRKAQDLMKSGDASKANEMYRRAVSISSRMVQTFIFLLKHMKISYIVAPYEADAQLGFLFRTGVASAIITEDSDLLLFGATRLLMKLDKFGNAQQLSLDAVRDVAEENHTSLTRELQGGMDQDMFLKICVLSGCDYLDSLPGVGLKTALKLFQTHHRLKSVLSSIAVRLKKKQQKIPESYPDDFERALLTFRHQTIYDTKSDCLRPLCPFDSSVIGAASPVESLSFLGPMLEAQRARALVCGKLDPRSLEAAPAPSALPSRLLSAPASVAVAPPAHAMVKANPMLRLGAARLQDPSPFLSVKQQGPQQGSLLNSIRRRFGPSQCVSMGEGPTRSPFKRRRSTQMGMEQEEVEEDVASLSSLAASDPSIAEEIIAGKDVGEVQLPQLSASDIESDEVRTFADRRPSSARKARIERPRSKARRRKSGPVQRPITSFFAKLT